MRPRSPRILLTLACACAAWRAPAAAGQDREAPGSAGAAVTSRDTTALLYHGVDYGSEAYFSPATVILNRGYDMIQIRNARRTILDIPYRNAFDRGVWDVLAHPVAAVDRFGWREWLRTEILPVSFSRDDSAWFVNYTDHLFMGGLTYRMLGEWYAARGAPVPRLWGALTTYASNLLNEAVENQRVNQGTAASVADLYVFDIGSLLFFSWDVPYRFFAVTLEAAEWSNMAAMTFPDRELQNNGQYWILKVPLPGTDGNRLFLRGGMGGELGVSHRMDRGYSLSLSVGLDTKVRTVDPVTAKERIQMQMGAGVYVDRDNSLLVSAVLSPAADKYALNLYPGVLPGPARRLGVWTVYTRSGDLMGGLAFQKALGLGVGMGW
jgi:hypothetical protein